MFISEDGRRFVRLYPYLPRRRRVQLSILVAALFLGALAEMVTVGLAVPFIFALADTEILRRAPLIADALSAVGAETPTQISIFITFIFCAVAMTAALVRVAVDYAMKRFVFRASWDISREVYRRILYQPFQYHIATNSAETVALMEKVHWTALMFLLPWLEVANALIVAIGIFVTLLIVDWRVALGVGGGMALIYGVIGSLARPAMTRIAKRIALIQSRRVQLVQESLGGIRDVILERRHETHLRSFANLELAFLDSQAYGRIIGTAPRYLVEGFGIILIAIVALLLSLSSDSFGLVVPTLVAFAVGAQRIMPLLQLIYNGLIRIKSSEVIIEEVLKVLELPLSVSKREVLPLPFTREIRFDNVSFCYRPEVPDVLKGVNLSISKGMRVGIIGATGSGKSTLVDIALGLLSPTSGTVFVDDVALDEATVPRWQARIAHVPQSVYLADASIRENIAFEADGADLDGRLVRATKQVGLHEFIAALPQGYDTPAGERGVRFSGGQRQRLVIARALFRDVDVIVLDEATSALDNATERSVMTAIDELRADLTVIMIAHRLTTLANCDLIIRLENGRIIESGDYDTIIGREHQRAGA